MCYKTDPETLTLSRTQKATSHPTCVRHPEQASPWGRKQASGGQELGRREEWALGLHLGWWKVWELDSGDGATTLWTYLMHWIEHFKMIKIRIQMDLSATQKCTQTGRSNLWLPEGRGRRDSSGCGLTCTARFRVDSQGDLLCVQHRQLCPVLCSNSNRKQNLKKKLLLLFSRQIVSDSLWPHGLKHARLLCPSPSPRVCPSSCSLSQWCHPTISSSVTSSPSCLQSFAASVFSNDRLFPSGDQSSGASALVLPMSI